MYYLVFFSFLIVMAVKYLTALELRRLERRLETVKGELQIVKGKFDQVQAKQYEAHKEEATFEERVRRMKEVIEDCQVRFTAPEETLLEKPLIPGGAGHPL